MSTPALCTRAIAIMLIWATMPGARAADPSINDYFPGGGRGLAVPEKDMEKLFRAGEDQANFTMFDGVTVKPASGSTLHLVLERGQALLGWGNYMGVQPVPKVKSLWYSDNRVVIRLKQSCAQSTWQGKFWADGKVLRDGRGRTAALKKQPVTGTHWQELVFDSPQRTMPVPDGLELSVEAKPGTTFELEWIKFVQHRCEGYARKEFTLPPGKVWRAVAQVGSANERMHGAASRVDSILYINGRRVDRPAGGLYGTAPVDIKPYLRRGENCAGFYGYRITHQPFIFFQASIIMESGEIIRVGTPDGWRVSADRVPGWNQPGLDVTGWTEAQNGWHVVSGFQNRLPAHEGYLVLQHPNRRYLAYRSTHDVMLKVEIPAGLAAKEPHVAYRLCRAGEDGAEGPVVAEDVDTTFAKSGGSLNCMLNLGRHDRGMYTVALRLLDRDGNLLDERPREPILVVGTRHRKHVDGRSYTEGLDLELVDTIDFTDPDDPHPCIETERRPGRPARQMPVAAPRVVTEGGLTYRLLRSERNSYLSYRLGAFDHPGDFYLFELTYPDTGRHRAQISVSQISAYKSFSDVPCVTQSGPGIETGGKFYNSGKMQTLRWLHVADTGVHRLDIKSFGDWPAAVGTVKIYHVRNDLPAVTAGNGRHYGIHTERQALWPNGKGYCRAFGVDEPGGRMDRKARRGEKLPLVQKVVRQMSWLLDAAERYTQYLKFSGQNVHIIGCIQYFEGNSPYMSADLTPRIPHDARSVLANVLDINGIDFLAGLEYSNPQDLKTFANNAQVARGADTVWMVDAQGRQFYGYGSPGCTVVPNWMHPRFKATFLEVLDNLSFTFGGLEHFKGVSNVSGVSQRTCYYFPAFALFDDDPLHFSYDDITFEAFEQDTGIHLPIPQDDPGRFEKRAALVRSPDLREPFLRWRCTRFTDFLTSAVERLRDQRPDLRLIDFIGVEEVDIFKQLVEQDVPFASFLKDHGVDLAALGQVPNLVPVRWTCSWDAKGRQQEPYAWVPKEHKLVLDAFEDLGEHGVMCRSSWHEGGMVAPEGMSSDQVEASDWLLPEVMTRTHPQPGHTHCREALIQAIITSAPEWVFTGFTDLIIPLGNEQALREVMRTYTQLPPGDFQPVLETGLRTMLAIRCMNRDDGSWCFVANPGFWPVRGTLEIDGPGPLTDVATGKTMTTGGRSRLNVSLPPFGLAAYKTGPGKLKINSFKTEPIPAAELGYLTGILDRVHMLLQDERARLALTMEERKASADIVTAARAAIARGEVALAWGLIKQPQFWTRWQDYLEKAADTLAVLPAEWQTKTPEYDPEAEAPEARVPHLTAAKAASTINVNGQLSEAAWKRVPFSTGFRTRGTGRPVYNQTGVKVVYDDKAVYVGFACADPEPEKRTSRARSHKELYYVGDDVLVMFIQPDADKPVYYQLAFNPSGVRFDQKMEGGEPDYAFAPAWETATAAGDAFWTAEARLPFDMLGVHTPPQQWRVNFCRMMREHALPHAEWSLVPGSWHSPERFGHLQFTD